MASAQKLKVNSKLKVTNWSQTFPAKLETKEASLKLMKKLLAVGTSTILYLRSNIPESAFNTCDVDGISMKILNTGSDNRAAKKITSWIKNAVDAIEKGYLEQLTLALYKDSNRPEEALETYQFQLRYEGVAKSPTLGLTSKILTTSEENDIFMSTQQMFRRIILQAQSLPPLPLEMFMTVLLNYNQDAPEDYDPPGYKASDLEFKIESEMEPVALGMVTSRFHSFAPKVHAKALVGDAETLVMSQQSRPIEAPPDSQSNQTPRGSASQESCSSLSKGGTTHSTETTQSILASSQPSQVHRPMANGDPGIFKRLSEAEAEGHSVTPQKTGKRRRRQAKVDTSEVKDSWH